MGVGPKPWLGKCGPVRWIDRNDGGVVGLIVTMNINDKHRVYGSNGVLFVKECVLSFLVCVTLPQRKVTS